MCKSVPSRLQVKVEMFSLRCPMVLKKSLKVSRTSLRLAQQHTVATAVEDVQETYQDSEWQTAKPFSEIPGPNPLPLIGNAWRFMPIIGEYHKTEVVPLFHSLYKTYGNIVRMEGIPGKEPTVHIFDPDEIAKVLRHEKRWPNRDFTPSFSYYRNVTRSDIFNGVGGVLASQGEEWQKVRTKVNQPLMNPRNIGPYIPHVELVADEFIGRMREIRDENYEMPADFFRELCKWGLESIALIALDTKLGVLKDGPNTEKLLNASQQVLEMMYQLDVRPSIWKYVSTPSWRKFVKAMDYFTEFTAKHVNEAMERIKEKSAAGTVDNFSILEQMLLRDPDTRVAWVTAQDLMFGGIDTTATATAVALYYLAKYPSKQQKLYEEIKRNLPNPEDRMTVEKLEAMRYLKACLKESLRLSPAAFGNARKTTYDLVLSGYQIPKGTMVFVHHMLLSNMEEYFPRANEYIPERWLPQQDGSPAPARSVHPFVYQPFGFGVRMCLGRRFAELEIHTLIIKILRNFFVEYNYEMQFKSKLIYQPASPLKFKVTERN